MKRLLATLTLTGILVTSSLFTTTTRAIPPTCPQCDGCANPNAPRCKCECAGGVWKCDLKGNCTCNGKPLPPNETDTTFDSKTPKPKKSRGWRR